VGNEDVIVRIDFFDYKGVRIITYYADAGETAGWHEHTFDHGHVVIAGRTRIDTHDGNSVEMIPGMKNMDFPAGVPHCITALEDGTIFLQPLEAI
jgi:quercetin dioxygenase-like cupin family protein